MYIYIYIYIYTLTADIKYTDVNKMTTQSKGAYSMLTKNNLTF